MKETISVLGVGIFDNSTQILQELQRGGFKPKFSCIETEEEMKQALLNSPWDLIINELDLSAIDEFLALKIATTYAGETPVIFMSKDFSSETVVSLMNAGARDCLREKHLQRLVPIVKRELKRSDTSKTIQHDEKNADFLANINHELRTGLNSIILLSKLLADDKAGNLNKEQREYIDAIYNSSNSLLELVDKVLDLFSIKNGIKKINPEPVNISEVCCKLERMYSPLAKENEVSLEFHIQDNTPDNIITDRICLTQLINNLLSNALKFTPSGRISVSVYVPNLSKKEKVGTSNGQIIAFEVKDTGIGIPKNKQDLIFERYRQADHSNREKYGGTGLGLAICKQIAQLLEGTLCLESEKGKGSTFTLYIPTGNNKSIATELKSNDKGINSNTKSKADKKIDSTILLVDDNNIHNLALKEFLSQKIKTCITANTAKETLNILEKNKVDCIILDMSLPDADGYDVVSHLKNQQKYQDISIIVYTGKKLSDETKMKLAKYTDDIVTKNAGGYKNLENAITSILQSSHMF